MFIYVTGQFVLFLLHIYTFLTEAKLEAYERQVQKELSDDSKARNRAETNLS